MNIPFSIADNELLVCSRFRHGRRVLHPDSSNFNLQAKEVASVKHLSTLLLHSTPRTLSFLSTDFCVFLVNRVDPDEIMELLWENGQIVMQSQNQRSFPKRPLIEDGAVISLDRREIRSSRPIESGLSNDQLFMQEDETPFWLHHYPPIEAADLYSDVIDPAPPRTAPNQDVRIPPPSTAAPMSQPRRSDPEESEAVQSSVRFSRAKARAVEQGPSGSNEAVRESTVVDSCETPRVAPESVASRVAGSTVEVSGGVAGLCVAAEGGGRDTGTYELTSSSGGSASLEPVQKPPVTAGDRKRKGREADDDDSESPGEVSKIVCSVLSCAGVIFTSSIGAC